MNTNNLNRAIDLPEPIAGCFFRANWVAPTNVKTLISTRNGGVSQPPFASLNVGAHVGDNPAAVAQNRAILQQHVPVPMVYLNQTHSTDVVQAALCVDTLADADASWDDSGRVACAVMTADCLPVLFCDRAGTVVAAAHAGWRGLAYGV
ncbi:polyphenol oxidase family protein, partial [Kingella kingae]|uniref:polyphenol oxidase family protein n=1 Tax=Kingella kingae TaxID=504 RepID=UPI001E2FFCCB